MDTRVIAVITLAVIPAAILAVSMMIRDGNPFIGCRRPDVSELKTALPLLSAVPLALIASYTADSTEQMLLLSLAPACILTAFVNADAVMREKRRERCELSLMDTVFDMGNMILSGCNFITAATESISSRKECRDVAESLRREYSLCRGDVRSAVIRAVSPVSTETGNAMADIHLCSERDSDDAGRLALALGKQFRSRRTALGELRSNLKSMTDMMTMTAAFFAPMVLGLSVSMLEPISKITDYSGPDGTSAILGVYLTELCALISILNASLGKGDGIPKIVWRFCLMCPVSLLVFTICCGISL